MPFSKEHLFTLWQAWSVKSSSSPFPLHSYEERDSAFWEPPPPRCVNKTTFLLHFLPLSFLNLEKRRQNRMQQKARRRDINEELLPSQLYRYFCALTLDFSEGCFRAVSALISFYPELLGGSALSHGNLVLAMFHFFHFHLWQVDKSRKQKNCTSASSGTSLPHNNVNSLLSRHFFCL